MWCPSYPGPIVIRVWGSLSWKLPPRQPQKSQPGGREPPPAPSPPSPRRHPQQMSLNRNSVLSDHGLDSPRTSPVITSRLYQHHRRQGSDTPFAPTAEQVERGRSCPGGGLGAGCWEGPCGRPCAPQIRCLAPSTVPRPLQGSERTGRPLIIGPEEDYDPGYFNNEVAAAKFLLASPHFIGVAGWVQGTGLAPLPQPSLCHQCPGSGGI